MGAGGEPILALQSVQCSAKLLFLYLPGRQLFCVIAKSRFISQMLLVASPFSHTLCRWVRFLPDHGDIKLQEGRERSNRLKGFDRLMRLDPLLQVFSLLLCLSSMLVNRMDAAPNNVGQQEEQKQDKPTSNSFERLL